MKQKIPATPLILTALGALPFLWGAMTTLSPALMEWAFTHVPARFLGPFVQLAYGQVILAFMSGVLWGFATRGRSTMGYVLSVIPALWAFFAVGGGAVTASINLIVGFLAVLALDWFYWRHGLTPDWWMQLRAPVTAVVVLSLASGAI